jgi:hypothetical protein
MSDMAHGSASRAGRGSRWRRLDRFLFHRATACVAACLSLLAVLGCMSISIGGGGSHEVKTAAADETGTGVLAQDGKVIIRPGVEQVIYYPVSYASPPNLELEDTHGFCDIVEQKEGFFRVRFRTGFMTSQESLPWKARGTRCPPPPSGPPAAAAETATPDSLPPYPVPVLTPPPQR